MSIELTQAPALRVPYEPGPHKQWVPDENYAGTEWEQMKFFAAIVGIVIVAVIIAIPGFCIAPFRPPRKHP